VGDTNDAAFSAPPLPLIRAAFCSTGGKSEKIPEALLPAIEATQGSRYPHRPKTVMSVVGNGFLHGLICDRQGTKSIMIARLTRHAVRPPLRSDACFTQVFKER